MSEEKRDLFLVDGSILPWERPPKPGSYSLSHMYNGNTSLIRQMGFDVVDEEVGGFRVLGAAVK